MQTEHVKSKEIPHNVTQKNLIEYLESLRKVHEIKDPENNNKYHYVLKGLSPKTIKLILDRFRECKQKQLTQLFSDFISEDTKSSIESAEVTHINGIDVIEFRDENYNRMFCWKNNINRAISGYYTVEDPKSNDTTTMYILDGEIESIERKIVKKENKYDNNAIPSNKPKYHNEQEIISKYLELGIIPFEDIKALKDEFSEFIVVSMLSTSERDRNIRRSDESWWIEDLYNILEKDLSSAMIKFLDTPTPKIKFKNQPNNETQKLLDRFK